MKRKRGGAGMHLGHATGGRVKKQSKAARKVSERAEKRARKASLKAEAKAHRAAVKAEAKAHRAALRAEALAHKQAVKAERLAHKEALHAHVVVAANPEEPLPEHAPTPEAVVVEVPHHADAQEAYDEANRALDAARAAFADLDWTTHTREDWIAASARLRAAWAAVDVARSTLKD